MFDRLSARDMSIFSFPDDNLSKYQWIFTKRNMCNHIVEHEIVAGYYRFAYRADDSHEMPSLVFSANKNNNKMLSATVLFSALRIKS